MTVLQIVGFRPEASHKITITTETSNDSDDCGRHQRTSEQNDCQAVQLQS